mmetsp:Transcript_26524/g.45149  ORF Transcript_26524/g.45149 Transcript_26524/m.45149 type:complete len:102 (+) Transcript_26524:444-749(+)
MFLCTASITNWNFYDILVHICDALSHANMDDRSFHNWELSSTRASNPAFYAILLTTFEPYQNQSNDVTIQNSQKVHHIRMLETHLGESIQAVFVSMEGNKE